MTVRVVCVRCWGVAELAVARRPETGVRATGERESLRESLVHIEMPKYCTVYRVKQTPHNAEKVMRCEGPRPLEALPLTLEALPLTLEALPLTLEALPLTLEALCP